MVSGLDLAKTISANRKLSNLVLYCTLVGGNSQSLRCGPGVGATGVDVWYVDAAVLEWTGAATFPVGLGAR